MRLAQVHTLEHANSEQLLPDDTRALAAHKADAENRLTLQEELELLKAEAKTSGDHQR